MTHGYRLSTDSADIDRERVHTWLSDQSYWAKGRARELQDAAIDASRNYAILDAAGTQVAYARVVTDGVTFAWLCDVFVDPAVRGSGAGKMLVAGVVADIESLPVKRIVLATADAHGLYAQYGFAPSEDPNRYMIRVKG
ncbi:GNAT family N-acetyltransferase [Microbacterium sp. H1-D42]|uniref:GNAT family N-acetyltransferase n=1 Tax=Microbacterium sp. H1-D42 TaxID=2925844 RepID=UPI001F52F5A6|nr:GNAT family N-acetyltransferase [Microbacterium sp. H1-D42]UNK69287.1 GNAT family N-acetyltransferase [Microbacterium sp. H1-D42]